MKVYRNSIYIFSILSIISLYLSYKFKSDSFIYSTFLGIFGSALITLFASIIYYFNEKEKIIADLGIKSLSLYSTLNSLLTDLKRCGEIQKIDERIHAVENCCHFFSNTITQYSIRSSLSNYYGILSPSALTKLYLNKEIQTIYSLWTMEQNLIGQLPLVLMNLERIGTCFKINTYDNDIEKINNNIKDFNYIYNDLLTNVPKQIEFLDTMLSFLLKYKNFPKKWEHIKNEISTHK